MQSKHSLGTLVFASISGSGNRRGSSMETINICHKGEKSSGMSRCSLVMLIDR